MESALPVTSYDVQMAANGLTSTETIRLIWDGEKEGWGGGMEMEEVNMVLNVHRNRTAY